MTNPLIETSDAVLKNHTQFLQNCKIQKLQNSKTALPKNCNSRKTAIHKNCNTPKLRHPKTAILEKLLTKTAGNSF